MTYTKEYAFKSLQPTAKWVIRDGVVEWLSDDIPQPTDAEIQTEIDRLQAEYDAKQYQRDRLSEYPSIGEQLDMQYWDAVNGTTTWKDAIAQVKADNPKPTE